MCLPCPQVSEQIPSAIFSYQTSTSLSLEYLFTLWLSQRGVHGFLKSFLEGLLKKRFVLDSSGEGHVPLAWACSRAERDTQGTEH